eukprot:Protomagalhaensia_sp_Gyna_25__508@NODE_123_length_5070_cov_465_993838_g97_i0_p1_GENE_NODE_123_length_5070_cov_465_993838_g97_i0NODE_123_length_5070_cov_465_993838_g97_i0_p1_ORF_typecomplete_len325_score67_97IMCp/PF12314_8/2e03IMCp/PF12314_8/0_00054IMCp/PF12314_8/1_2IMCp/PF12314_8/1_5e03YuzL/PF14115_6/0_49_NODE_123_length_5070_cov_465_993838_g97_i0921066
MMMTTPSHLHGSMQPSMGTSIMGGSSVMGHGTTTSRHVTGEYVQSTRKKSSTVIDEQYLSPIPQDTTREVEVHLPPETVVKYVNPKQVREVEKFVKVPQIEWQERVVVVPKIEYVDKMVEVPHVQEIVREVKVPQWVDVPKEVIREVKKPEVRYVEKIVQVPQIIEVDKPYRVEKPVPVIKHVDNPTPLVVAQTIRPYIVEGATTIDVDVVCYEPECIPIDIHVPRPVSAQIQAGGVVESTHRVISVPAAQYNTILKQINTHLAPNELEGLPFMRDASGRVSFLSESVSYTTPAPGTQIIGYSQHTHTSHQMTVNQTRTTAVVN